MTGAVGWRLVAGSGVVVLTGVRVVALRQSGWWRWGVLRGFGNGSGQGFVVGGAADHWA